MDERDPLEEAIAAAAAGRARGFEALWRALDPALTRYLRVAAPEAAEDLASETWLTVARDLRRFRGDGRDLRRWFFTIARHRVIDYRRKRARTPSDPVSAEAFAGALDRPDPADPIEEAMSASAALDIIRALPADQAEAVTLRVVAGLTVDQVARVMGKRPGAVRVLTHRGLRALAERLAPPAREPESGPGL